MGDTWDYTSRGYAHVEQDDPDEPRPEYTCGDCGVTFDYFGDECCPECGSTNIEETTEWPGWNEEADDEAH